ncbi:MAG: Gfo/Idh/MocA family oxidoreductase, partial [Chloroflexia bacterium]
MEELKVGIIGCGRPLSSEGSTGYGMSHWHARGYAAADCRLTALADVNLENAHAFQLEHGAERVYQDYREMLAEENLDIVSVCTWPPLHPEMVVAAANAGVRAIHCEKPIAPTYAESLQMVEA